MHTADTMESMAAITKQSIEYKNKLKSSYIPRFISNRESKKDALKNLEANYDNQSECEINMQRIKLIINSSNYSQGKNDTEASHQKISVLPSYTECLSEILEKITNFENIKEIEPVTTDKRDIEIQDNLSSTRRIETLNDHGVNESKTDGDWFHDQIQPRNIPSDMTIINESELCKELCKGLCNSDNCKFKNDSWYNYEHHSQRNPKICQIYNKWPSNRYRLPKIFLSWRRRISIRRIHHKRLKPMKNNDPLNGWSTKMLILDRTIHMMHFLQIQRSIFLEDADVQTSTLVCQNAGIDSKLNERRSAVICDTRCFSSSKEIIKVTKPMGIENATYVTQSMDLLISNKSTDTETISSTTSEKYTSTFIWPTPICNDDYTEPIFTSTNADIETQKTPSVSTDNISIGVLTNNPTFISKSTSFKGEIQTQLSSFINQVYLNAAITSTPSSEAKNLIDTQGIMIAPKRGNKDISIQTHRLIPKLVQTGPRLVSVSSKELSEKCLSCRGITLTTASKSTITNIGLELKSNKNTWSQNNNKLHKAVQFEELMNNSGRHYNRLDIPVVYSQIISSNALLYNQASTQTRTLINNALPQMTLVNQKNTLATTSRLGLAQSIQTCPFQLIPPTKKDFNKLTQTLLHINCSTNVSSKELIKTISSRTEEESSFTNQLLSQKQLITNQKQPNSRTRSVYISAPVFSTELSTDKWFEPSSSLEGSTYDSQILPSDERLAEVLPIFKSKHTRNRFLGSTIKKSKVKSAGHLTLQLPENSDIVVNLLPTEKSNEESCKCEDQTSPKIEEIANQELSTSHSVEEQIMIDATTSDDNTVRSKPFELRVVPCVCHKGTDAPNETCQHSVGISTTQCILPIYTRCNYADNSEKSNASCVFVFGSPVCAVHRQTLNEIIQTETNQKGDEQKETEFKQEIETEPNNNKQTTVACNDIAVLTSIYDTLHNDNPMERKDVAIMTPLSDIIPKQINHQNNTGIVLSPKDYQALYEATKILVNEDINKPPVKEFSALNGPFDASVKGIKTAKQILADKTSDNKTAVSATNVSEITGAVQSISGFTSANNVPATCMEQSNVAEPLHSNTTDVKSASVVTSMWNAKRFRLRCHCNRSSYKQTAASATQTSSELIHDKSLNSGQNNAEAEDVCMHEKEVTFEDFMTNQLVTSCRYYSNLLTKQLGKVKENLKRHLAQLATEEEGCEICSCALNNVCTMTPSGREELACQTNKAPSYQRQKQYKSCCMLTQSISLTDICRHDKEHLKSVYNILAGIEGRLRRLKMGVTRNNGIKV